MRGYSEKTRDAYVYAVRSLAEYYHRSPDLLSDEELRSYLLYLHQDTPKAASTLNVAVSGMRFFYQRVLQRPFTLDGLSFTVTARVVGMPATCSAILARSSYAGAI